MTEKAQITTYHSSDVLIIGAGGAGLRAAIEAARGGASVAVVTKVPPTRSHTVAAQGGINAALGNVAEDNWRWHAYDTIRGSDWLGDQDAIRYMCKEAPKAILELEEMGVPFTRDAQGKIYQRPYGGMSTHYGKGDPAFRACAAADRTGDAMMTGLYDYVQRFPVAFFEEFIVIDLLMDAQHACLGCVAWELESGELHCFLAHNTIIATGGYGQIFASATSSSTCTGDGNAMLLRAGLPLMDMEFIQFHPTGMVGSGILISEAARAEGGVLRNSLGERFMERYAPTYRDLASRDVVTRAIMQEIREGRGCGEDGAYVELDVTAVSPEHIAEYLPGTESLARQLMNIDITKEPIPVVPTAHYTMGGIPTNLDGQVLDAEGEKVAGLFAIGEAACTSVHGANRLGCNSLLDLVVFGKRAGEVSALDSRTYATPLSKEHIPQHAVATILERFHRLRMQRGCKDPYSFCKESQSITEQSAGILRDATTIAQGMNALDALQEEMQRTCHVHHRDLRWNNGLVTLLETENLIALSLATLHSAAFRTESRGAHSRTDFPARDDTAWLCHTLVCYDTAQGWQCSKKTVRLEASHGEAALLPEMRAY